ncbi:UDPGT domain-containing protein [Cephalotus follicularis]|uniref:UDPGT domain-containing protein n=1 Tax=Cephalotus follicularis TaxID=3775 RepID=A0A1Q3C6V8_CEPFO|nr:UDPGT domain-containing protein [Cephalotus follicularis]
MSNAHVLVLPFPAQGHVNPMMLLSKKLAKDGCKVTFVNTDFFHKKIKSAMALGDSVNHDQIHMVSIPDGMGPEDDRNELGKLCAAMLNTMPAKLEELIRGINCSSKGDNPITCVLADLSMGWAMEIAEKMGIGRAVFWPQAAASLALTVSIPKLIDDGIINSDGFPYEKQMFKLSASIPSVDTAHFQWYCIGKTTTDKKNVFNYTARLVKYLQLANWSLCHTIHGLEPGAFSFLPELLAIGSLTAGNATGNSGGQFWSEDSTCLKWLDQQQPRSVIYVAFGSYTLFSQTQFQELALGLEHTNTPFLWVVRPGTTKGFPNGFQGIQGKIVDWAPQPQVLNHPSIACFLSHCGWNSTLEGLSNGVPFLCWPYFADQFLNKSYICDVWKVGIGFQPDENEIVTRWELKKKVEQLLGNEDIRRRSLELKEMAMNNNTAEASQCSQNFCNFIKWLKA